MKMSPTGPGPAYRIHTRRLVLRCWNPKDAPLLSAAIEASLEHLRPWMPWIKDEPKGLEDRIHWLRHHRGEFDLGQDFYYGVFNLDETRVLGACGLHTGIGKEVREIGYWIHAGHTNQGLGAELTAALTKVAFEVDEVHRVEIHCDPNNLRSAAIPRKLGFLHEATLRQRKPTTSNERSDSMIWSLLASEYPTSKSAAAKIEAFDVIGCRIL